MQRLKNEKKKTTTKRCVKTFDTATHFTNSAMVVVKR